MTNELIEHRLLDRIKYQTPRELLLTETIKDCDGDEIKAKRLIMKIYLKDKGSEVVDEWHH